MLEGYIGSGYGEAPVAIQREHAQAIVTKAEA
jgi:hypothetical protein